MLPALLICTVVGISDGDTLTARCSSPSTDQSQAHKATTHRVRLAEIDAPEKGQPFGQVSKQHLAALCFRKPAELRPTALDRYGRTVAHVRCAGADAGAYQVRAGMAWVFARYATKGSALYAAQQQAHAARQGLWADPSPTPPWEWRRQAATGPGAAEGL